MKGTSRDGFDAEWQEIGLFTLEGDLISRCELFDEADLGAALARFDELQPQARQVDNAASQVNERFWSYYRARAWDAMAQLLADDISTNDRRRVVNAGVQHGRDNAIADMRALAEVEANIAVAVIATRGERLVLTRVGSSNRDLRHGEFGVELLAIAEIDTDNQIVATVLFDPDDFYAALGELDVRYVAGEAAANAHTWSVITQMYAALNRHELPRVTPNWVNVDHRRGTNFAPGDLLEYLRAGWDLHKDINYYIEAVHRLSDVGTIVTHAVHGRSQEGFAAEWRMIEILTVEGDRINRCELFDEEDLDAALARFDELHTQAREPKNAATQVTERFLAQFAARDWDAMPEMMADNFSSDDRRRVVGAGVRQGRNAQITDMRAIADLGITYSTTTHVATRGERLALSRTRMSARDQPFYGEMLDVLEVNADAQIVEYVVFDPNELDAAIAELDARYVAGEAAAHADTWSVIAEAMAGFTRREPPATTPDAVYVDHRPLVTTEAVDLSASLRAMWDLISDVSICIEAVHRLDEFGAVITQTVKLTSQEDFDAEWRMINVFTIEGGLISRTEVFDEADLDAALARFDELHPPARRLENAASQVGERYMVHFEAGDWDAIAEILADDFSSEDRRRVVGAGVRHGRDAEIVDMRAIAGLGSRT
jgi:hypothetical protein